MNVYEYIKWIMLPVNTFEGHKGFRTKFQNCENINTTKS